MPRVIPYVRSCLAATAAEQKACIRSHYVECWQPQGYTLAPSVEDVCHGRTPFSQRHGWFQITTRARLSDVVVLAVTQAGFRRLRDLMQMVRVWGSRGVQLMCLDLSPQPLTARDVELLNRVAAFEEAVSLERGREVAALKRARGRQMGGGIPAGMRRVGMAGRKRLIWDRSESDLVKAIAEWREAGYSFRQIWSHLRSERVKTKFWTAWTKSRVERAYAGYRRKVAMDATS
jgi:DNA invertase Pin-like site-specific DNA recombinase